MGASRQKTRNGKLYFSRNPISSTIHFFYAQKSTTHSTRHSIYLSIFAHPTINECGGIPIKRDTYHRQNANTYMHISKIDRDKLFRVAGVKEGNSKKCKIGTFQESLAIPASKPWLHICGTSGIIHRIQWSFPPQ